MLDHLGTTDMKGDRWIPSLLLTVLSLNSGHWSPNNDPSTTSVSKGISFPSPFPPRAEGTEFWMRDDDGDMDWRLHSCTLYGYLS